MGAPRWDPRPGAPCKFFAEGNCEKGDLCKFSHDGAEPSDLPDMSLVDDGGKGGRQRWDAAAGSPCKFFTEGFCRSGDACRFSHDGVVPSEAMMGDPDDLHFGRDEDTGIRQGKQKWDPVPGAPCKFFFEGSCRNGNACKYSHDGPAPFTDEFSAREPHFGQEGKGKSQRWDASAGAPCKFFFETGTCRNGDECRFSHGEVDSSPIGKGAVAARFLNPGSQGKGAAGKPCMFYSLGQCKNGAACRFSHDDGAPGGSLKRKGDSGLDAFQAPAKRFAMAASNPLTGVSGGGKGGGKALAIAPRFAAAKGKGGVIGKGFAKGKAPPAPRFDGFLDHGVKRALGWWNTEGGCSQQISYNVVAPLLSQFEPDSAIGLLGGLESVVGEGCSYNDWIVDRCAEFGAVLR